MVKDWKQILSDLRLPPHGRKMSKTAVTREARRLAKGQIELARAIIRRAGLLP